MVLWKDLTIKKIEEDAEDGIFGEVGGFSHEKNQGAETD